MEKKKVLQAILLLTLLKIYNILFNLFGIVILDSCIHLLSMWQRSTFTNTFLQKESPMQVKELSSRFMNRGVTYD